MMHEPSLYVCYNYYMYINVTGTAAASTAISTYNHASRTVCWYKHHDIRRLQSTAASPLSDVVVMNGNSTSSAAA